MRPAIPLVCLAAFFTLGRDKPETFADIRDHFKYGSIGAEGRSGIPYWIWQVLPKMFPDHLPARAGAGYARFGMIFESPDARRPIGSSYRETQIPMVGLNCAVCHTGTLRSSAESPRQIILGMPAHQLDLQSYERFLFACGNDPRFTAGNILRAVQEANPRLSWWDRLLYRFLVIPRTRDGLQQQSRNYGWFDGRPAQGPGRVDTFNPYKVLFGFDMRKDSGIGTADLPSLWDQKIREGLWLHWDGNNNLVTERNKSAAIGAGASPESLDLTAMKRIEDWIWDLKPPDFPRNRIDAARVESGRRLYTRTCAGCHDPGQSGLGQTIPLEKIGTDPERVRSFTAELATKLNTLGTGKAWKFSHFRKTEGYASMPLDGIWLRAPYLHNGSVPTLRDLLKVPEQRPPIFWRGYDVYDYAAVGFVSSGREAEREGFRYDTGLPGNGRHGHLYGTDLSVAEKGDLLEYLKTL